MKKIPVILILSALFVATPCAGVLAYDGHWHGDIHHFHEHDMERWHSGYWANRFHDGRNGWWWVIGPEWYYYPAPVYPYPDPFIPPTIVVQQPAVPAPAYWYCQNPAGYYPYVPVCYTQWQTVSSAASQPQTFVTQKPVVPQNSGPRETDDKKLNELAAEFYRINPEEKNAIEHLKNLKTRVEKFRQSLFEHNYNAMDILKDTETLEHKIEEKESDIADR